MRWRWALVMLLDAFSLVICQYGYVTNAQIVMIRIELRNPWNYLAVAMTMWMHNDKFISVIWVHWIPKPINSKIKSFSHVCWGSC